MTTARGLDAVVRPATVTFALSAGAAAGSWGRLGEAGYIVLRNKPFAGGFTTRHYGAPRNGVHAVQIEVNRLLYMDEMRIEKNAGFPVLQDRIGDLVATLAELTAQDLAAE